MVEYKVRSIPWGQCPLLALVVVLAVRQLVKTAVCAKADGGESGSVISGRKGVKDLACKTLLPDSGMVSVVPENSEKDLTSGILPLIFLEL